MHISWRGVVAGGTSSLLFMVLFSAFSLVRAASMLAGGFLPSLVLFCAACFAVCLSAPRFRTLPVFLSFTAGAFTLYLLVALSLGVAFQTWQPEIL